MKKSFNILLMVGMFFSINEMNGMDDCSEDRYAALCNLRDGNQTDDNLKKAGYNPPSNLFFKKAMGFIGIAGFMASLNSGRESGMIGYAFGMVASYKLILDHVRGREETCRLATNQLISDAMIACQKSHLTNESNKNLTTLRSHIQNDQAAWSQFAEKPYANKTLDDSFFGTEEESYKVLKALIPVLQGSSYAHCAEAASYLAKKSFFVMKGLFPDEK